MGIHEVNGQTLIGRLIEDKDLEKMKGTLQIWKQKKGEVYIPMLRNSRKEIDAALSEFYHLDNDGKPVNYLTQFYFSLSNMCFDPADWKNPVIVSDIPASLISWVEVVLSWHHGQFPKFKEGCSGTIESEGYCC